MKLATIVACAMSLAFAGDVIAQTRYEAVHTFSGNRGRPFAALTEGQDGRLYGSTTAGGFFGKGSVYVIDAGIPTTLHEFDGSDGESPKGTLFAGSDGALYGTTSKGGDLTCRAPEGCGTVFRIAPDGTFATLVRFDGSNGADPEGGLVEGADGVLFGTTLTGGTTPGGETAAGTVFRISATGALTTVVTFDGANGAFPIGTLTRAADGSLYGATRQGGPAGFGTVFRLTPDGVLSTVVSFSGANGANPSDSPILASDGNLYGTTQLGGGMTCGRAQLCGTIYRITPDMLEADRLHTLVSFSDANGALPTGALRQLSDGDIYGTTMEGGAANAGTVFRLSLDGTFTSVASFNFDNGGLPQSGVIQATSGAIYGTTEEGGPGLYGTVFELLPDGGIRTIVSFTGAVGADPSGRLTQASDGHFYGITTSGGENGAGAIFRMTRDGMVSTVASLESFSSGGLMQASDGYLYGTTDGGGDTGDGTIFRVSLGGTLTRLASFDVFANGAAPSGGLIEGSDGDLYGTTLFGVVPPEEMFAAPGGVFRFNRSDSTIVAEATFAMDDSDGVFPSSGVIEAPDGSFYGTAEMGGNGFGTVFRVFGGDVSAVASFSEDNPYPASPLLLATDGNLYGTTYGDGFASDGSVFQLMLDGSHTLNTLASFDFFLNGSFPYQQGLIEAADGSLWGTTTLGGPDGFGTVYRWSPEGGITTIHSFDGLTGDGPNSTLIKASDGAAYGTAFGPQGGVVYRIVSDNAAASLEVTPATAIYGGVTTLSATLSLSGSPIVGAELAFSINSVPVGSPSTGADGVATLAGISVAGIDAGSYPGGITASFAGGDGVQPIAAQGDLTIARAMPTIAMNDATYTYDGLPHPAIASVTGVGGEALGPLTFTYNGDGAPPIEPGSYSVVASYAQTMNYEAASATAVITILPAPPGLNGLIAAYGFEEGFGGLAGDASGNGHIGAIKQAQWTAGGRFGRALDFDGVNDWVTVQDAADLDIQTAITIEAWVNPRSLSGWNTILMKEGDARLAYALYANDWDPRPAGYIRVAGIDQAAIGSSGLPLNTWTHVALTYSGSMLRLYVNGDEVGRRALTGKILATGGALRIGGNAIWGEYFNGRIDEVRIYGRELSASEIARDMNAPIAHEALAPSVAIDSPLDGAVLSGVPAVTVSASDNFGLSSVQLQVDGVDSGAPLAAAPFTFRLDAANGTHVLRAVARDVAGNMAISDPITVTIANAPVADYGFNEGVGSLVTDASGRNNIGLMSGGVSRITDAVRGRVLSFNGFDGLVSVADAASLDLTTGMTLEAWIRPTVLDGWRTVIIKEGDGLSYALYANEDAARPAGYVRINDVDHAVRGRKKLALGAWTHLAMTYDGAMMRLFVNGIEVESRRQAGAAEVSDGKLRIGGNKVWGEWFRGQMDDVRIYDVAVGAAQIKADMNR